MNNHIPTNPPNVVNSCAPCTTSLYKVTTNANDNLTGSTTITTSGNVYKAFSTLTISSDVNFSSTASADLYALNQVHVEAEFHAINGSEIHIFNAPVLVDCSDILAATPPPHDGFRKGNYQKADNLFLELSFRKAGELVKVYPNPGTGIFNISYYGSIDLLKNIKVFDMIGNLVFINDFAGNSSVMNLSNLTKGVYSVQINDQSNLFNKRIIIQ